MCIYIIYMCIYIIYMCIYIHTDRQTYIHTYIHTYRQTDRQTQFFQKHINCRISRVVLYYGAT